MAQLYVGLFDSETEAGLSVAKYIRSRVNDLNRANLRVRPIWIQKDKSPPEPFQKQSRFPALLTSKGCFVGAKKIIAEIARLLGTSSSEENEYEQLYFGEAKVDKEEEQGNDEAMDTSEIHNRLMAMSREVKGEGIEQPAHSDDREVVQAQHDEPTSDRKLYLPKPKDADDELLYQKFAED
jgi:hypothetical protein